MSNGEEWCHNITSRTDHLSMYRLRIHLHFMTVWRKHSQGWGRVRIYFKIFSLEGHQQLTVSSPYRWWFCGLMSTLPLLPPAPPHCCCDLFSPSWFLLSCPVVHITWNPWVSIVKSSMLRNGIRNQSVLFFSLLSFTPSEGMSQFTVWRQLCVLSQDKPVFVCL